jgi:hypothetical protein
LTEDEIGWTREDDRQFLRYTLLRERKRQIARLEARVRAANEVRERLDEEVAEVMATVDLDRELSLLLEGA